MPTRRGRPRRASLVAVLVRVAAAQLLRLGVARPARGRPPARAGSCCCAPSTPRPKTGSPTPASAARSRRWGASTRRSRSTGAPSSSAAITARCRTWRSPIARPGARRGDRDRCRRRSRRRPATPSCTATCRACCWRPAAPSRPRRRRDARWRWRPTRRASRPTWPTRARSRATSPARSRHLRRAIARDPRDADAHWNLGLTLLAAPATPDDEAEGWRALEWRHRIRGLGVTPRRRGWPAIPVWTGEPLAGRTLLLQAEQGLGDTLQLARYARAAKVLAGAGATILECQPPLERLLRRCAGVDAVVARGAALPRADVRVGPVQRAGAAGRAWRRRAPPAPYLTAEPERIAHWRGRLARTDRGRALPGRHRLAGQSALSRRRAPVDRARPLRAAAARDRRRPGGAVVSLQKGEGRAAARRACRRTSPWSISARSSTRDGAFVDSAALMTGAGSGDHLRHRDPAPGGRAGRAGLDGARVAARLALGPAAARPAPGTRRCGSFARASAGDWAGVFARLVRAVGRAVTGRR